MPAETPLKDPWLVAAWPGIGNVGVGAIAYLIEQLPAVLVHELPADELFDANHVEVTNGVTRPASLPRSMFFEWRGAETNHDLLIFLAEAQPPAGRRALCRRIMDYAIERGVTRVFTLAAMATQLHPSARPRVFGAATDQKLLPGLREFTVEILQDGQIGGLNGLLLAAAAEHNVPSACLLGELPYFAGGIPNPKASRAVLEVLTKLIRVEIDFSKIHAAGQQVEAVILELLRQMKETAAQEAEAAEDVDHEPFAVDTGEDEVETPQATETPDLDEQDLARIESLFEQARQERNKAFQLKAELDRLGVFDRYENRFLDLFKRGE